MHFPTSVPPCEIGYTPIHVSFGYPVPHRCPWNAEWALGYAASEDSLKTGKAEERSKYCERESFRRQAVWALHDFLRLLAMVTGNAGWECVSQVWETGSPLLVAPLKPLGDGLKPSTSKRCPIQVCNPFKWPAELQSLILQGEIRACLSPFQPPQEKWLVSPSLDFLFNPVFGRKHIYQRHRVGFLIRNFFLSAD